MLFPTIEFGIFFVVVLIYSWGLRRNEILWKLFLLGASYYFYGNWDVRFLSLIVFVSITIFVLSVLIGNSNNQLYNLIYLWAGIILTLGVLGVFKYYNFFIDNLYLLIGKFIEIQEVAFIEIVLPVGISFFTFQGISHLVDVYRGDAKTENTFLGMIDFFVYIAFFPQLVAGPIVRSTVFLPQFKSNYRNNIIEYDVGIYLILIGLVKKLLISTYLQINIVDPVLNAPLNYAPIDVILAVYGFSIQIFCDFSGYSDIAIGVAYLLGFEFPENFNSPYKAANIQEFWRRWHISLSTWLRDYLYIPLGGSRKGELRTNINILVTMVLGGLWHGASMSFIFWGSLHGIAIVFHRKWTNNKVEFAKYLRFEENYINSIIYKVISVSVTFNFVSFVWVFFYHKEFETALAVFKAVLNIEKVTEGVNLYVLLLIIAGYGINYIENPLKRLYVNIHKISPIYVKFILNSVLLLLIVQFSPDIVPPFIYFKF